MQPSAPWQRLSLSSVPGEVSLWERAVFHIQQMSFCCCCFSTTCFSRMWAGHVLWFPKNFTPSWHFEPLIFFTDILLMCLFTLKKAYNYIYVSYYPVFNTKRSEHSTKEGDKANGTIIGPTDGVSLIASPFWLSHILIRSRMLHSIPLKPSRPSSIKGRLERSLQRHAGYLTGYKAKLHSANKKTLHCVKRKTHVKWAKRGFLLFLEQCDGRGGRRWLWVKYRKQPDKQ